jgi:glycosyltransferase involved in cell wall biosynthesis
MGLALVEATVELEHFDFTTADRWHVVILEHGIPISRVELASPGATSAPHLARAAILRHADRARELAAATRALERRLGVRPEPTPVSRTISVVVCTYGRPEHLPRALDALARLDPAPSEVVIVDNAPGAQDCRELVESYGFRYVREDRKGLDNARNAGIAAARGELLAFTDDDCVPPPAWLRFADELFANPQVAAVTGPALPFTLASEAQVAMERQASLGRGLTRQSWDWTTVNPANAGQVGAGANMLYRREVVAAMGPQPFPPELDAGTVTGSGGDTYILHRLLAAGHRVIYDPGTFVFHVHRPDREALDRAVFGYGSGVTALATKLLVEHREWEAPRGPWWLWSQLRQTARQYLLGRADEQELRIAWRYLAGGLRGPARWVQSRRHERGYGLAGPVSAPPVESMAAEVAPAPAMTGTESPTIAVIVPTVDRPAALARCLAGLAAQEIDPGAFEVVVVDDAPVPSAALGADLPFASRLLRSGGVGAAQARNLGARSTDAGLVLFLDDDLVPEPGFVAAHLAAHGGHEAAVVIGHCPPRPARRTLAALGAELWWEDHFAAMRTAPRLTFTEALSGNTSLARERFLDHGGFPEDLSQWRREDWFWGLTMLDSGAELVYEPGAVAAHEFSLMPAARMRASYGEARGDVLLARRWPAALAALPAASHRAPTARTPLRLLAFRALGRQRSWGVLAKVLELLERAHLRHPWMHLHNMGQRASYAAGLRDAGFATTGMASARADAEICDIDLCSDEPVAAPRVTIPVVRVHADGAAAQELLAPEGHWGAPLAQHIARSLQWPLWRAALPQAGPPPPAADAASVTIVTACSAAAAAARQLGAHVFEAAPGALWRTAATTVDDGVTPFVAILLNDVIPDRAWLDATLMPFDGERVAATIGEVYEAAEPEPPTLLHDLDPRALPFLRLGLHPAFLVLRADAVRDVGGLDPVDELGASGVLLRIVERLLEAGHVVAERSSPELGATMAFVPDGGRPGIPYGELRRAGLRLSLERARRAGGRPGALLALRTTVTGANDARHSVRGALRRARPRD